ncbi:hypothetical protein AG1IA_07157 [Rhizoctonia solani AG-1 IA]|uniref:Uncharacterized protein n=1 Tax=Thanatephorus cucumeris (strain AG1-IA) TaxID=983506 RepID=L8WKX7_THACA|nr:hypothetical protein AG1IA_07157 [Rhizoctonia solani AG-1 IA]
MTVSLTIRPSGVILGSSILGTQVRTGVVEVKTWVLVYIVTHANSKRHSKPGAVTGALVLRLIIHWQSPRTINCGMDAETQGYYKLVHLRCLRQRQCDTESSVPHVIIVRDNHDKPFIDSQKNINLFDLAQREDPET